MYIKKRQSVTLSHMHSSLPKSSLLPFQKIELRNNYTNISFKNALNLISVSYDTYSNTNVVNDKGNV